MPSFYSSSNGFDMYAHPSTQENLEKAEKFGHHIIPAEFGELASGLVGQGRLAENETILQKIEDFLQLHIQKH
jgi:phosphopantothenoylcysteine decarboxylase/phosphopantothenate--cysteine ligase